VVYSQTGSGQALVLLHGFLEDKSMWDDFVSDLSTEFRVITPDLLGQGETGNLGYIHSMEDMATSVSSILDKEEIKRFTVVGHSMGGYVALALAEMRPKSLAGLVLFHSTAYADSDERKKDRERVIGLVQRAKGVYTKTVIPSLFSDEWRVKLKNEIQQLIDRANSYSDQGITANIRGMMDRKDRSFIMKDGEFPKLIVHGELDSVIATYDIEKQAALNENIELQKSADIGHMGHLEARDKTLAILKVFCKK
jgi:pimeloyl-ACP methyl ester carboxylesterase